MSSIDAIAIHEAYVNGDLDGLRFLLGDPPDFPNCRGPIGMGEIVLEYAIYHSPMTFIRTLLEMGADANYPDHAGFPSLIATLTTEREDRYDILRMLLSFGADIQQYGHNGYTPLHWAAAADDSEVVEFLLKEGADPTARTLVDDYNTPEDEAQLLGCENSLKALRAFKR
jgi:ankyrin repeat protein